jgi:hypothetical protein
LVEEGLRKIFVLMTVEVVRGMNRIVQLGEA